MSEPQEKIDISDLKDTFLECPVCVEHFNQTDKRPRLLHSCLHAFCTQCLHQLLIKEGKGQITCPLCRQVQKISGKVDTLPADPVRGKLVDYLQIKHKRKVLCSECEEGDAISRCQKCQFYLCKECDDHHKRHRITRDHTIISLDDVLQQPVKSLSKGHFCPIHPEHRLEFYCSSEEQLCCVSCTVLDHKGHELLKLDAAAAKRKRETEERLNDVYRLADDLKEARKQGKEQAKLIAKTKEISLSHIDSMFDELKKVLDERRQELVADVNNKSNSLLSVVQKTSAAHDQTLAIIDSTDTYYTQAKEKADVVEILQTYPAIKRSFSALKEPETISGFDKAIADFTFSKYNSREMERLTGKFNSFGQSHDNGDGDVVTLPNQVKEHMQVFMNCTSQLHPSVVNSNTWEETRKSVSALGLRVEKREKYMYIQGSFEGTAKAYNDICRLQMQRTSKSSANSGMKRSRSKGVESEPSITVKPLHFEAVKYLFGQERFDACCHIEDVSGFQKQICFIVGPGNEKEVQDLQQHVEGVIQEELDLKKEFPSVSEEKAKAAAEAAMRDSHDVYIKYKEDKHSLIMFAEDWEKMSKAKKKVVLHFGHVKVSSRVKRGFVGSEKAEAVDLRKLLQNQDQNTQQPDASGGNNCPICLDPVTNPATLKCGDVFCKPCIDEAFKVKKVCPICHTVCGTITGNMPIGVMKDRVDKYSVSGYEGYNTIVITYNFNGGTQSPEHPHPGQRYLGTTRTAYLPDTAEGRKILALLKVAWDRRLTFTVGQSVTMSGSGGDRVTWNEINHKTNTTGGSTNHGYPDPDYLRRVQEELAAQGVTEEDLGATGTSV